MTPNSFYQLQALLNQKGSVSIPGIGTFFRSINPAQVQEEIGLIAPPSEAVRFKKEVDFTALFSKHLTEAQFLHPEISEQLEAELGAYLRRQLKLSGKVSLPNWGLLQLEGDGKLTFTSFKVDKLRSDDQHFGLKPIKLPNKPKSSGIPEITMSPMNNGTPTYETARKQSPINWQPYLLVGLLVLIGVLVIYNGPFINSQSADAGVTISEERSTPFEEAYPDNTAPKQQPITDAQNSGQGELASASPVGTSPNEAVSAAPKQQATNTVPSTPQKTRGLEDKETTVIIQDLGQTSRLSDLRGESEIPSTVLDRKAVVYHLISASFTQLSKAKEFSAEMAKEGFKTEIILPGNGPSQIHRVSIFQSNDLSQVKDLQRQLEAEGKKLLWIFNARPVQ